MIFHFEYLIQFISFHVVKSTIQFRNKIYLKYRFKRSLRIDCFFLLHRFWFTVAKLFVCLCVGHFAFVDSVTGKIYHYSVNVQEKNTQLFCVRLFLNTQHKNAYQSTRQQGNRIQLNVYSFLSSNHSVSVQLLTIVQNMLQPKKKQQQHIQYATTWLIFGCMRVPMDENIYIKGKSPTSHSFSVDMNVCIDEYWIHGYSMVCGIASTPMVPLLYALCLMPM